MSSSETVLMDVHYATATVKQKDYHMFYYRPNLINFV